MTHRSPTRAHWMLPLAALLLAACARQPEQQQTELDWARAALARNPQFEVVASDTASGTLTLRDRSSGKISVVALQDIAAAPLAQFSAPEPAPAPIVPVEPATAAEPAPVEPAAVAAAPEPATVDPNAKPYTIDRSNGQLTISGPGISVVSAGPATKPATQGPRAAEPIICEGRRMLQLDNRNIRVEGDAITVRGGCELYITNSTIVASGTGVMIHDGIVHVANSHIEGATSSFQADSGAKVYARGSTFQGLSRRDPQAVVQDQGGNRWR